jgi:uncharacterized integral membrane protein
MSILTIAFVGAVVIGALLLLVRIVEAIDDARRERRRQRALDSLRL